MKAITFSSYGKPEVLQAGPLEEAEYDEHSLVWDKGLQKIKELSEAQVKPDINTVVIGIAPIFCLIVITITPY